MSFMLHGIARLERMKIRAGVGDQKVISVLRKAVPVIMGHESYLGVLRESE